jgi:hypothetical protein
LRHPYLFWVFVTNKGAQCKNLKTSTDMRSAGKGTRNLTSYVSLITVRSLCKLWADLCITMHHWQGFLLAGNFIQKMQFQSSDYHYLRCKITPPTKDVLMIRKTITDCLMQTFGSTVASIFLDILWIDEIDDLDDDGDGKECVIRTHIM